MKDTIKNTLAENYKIYQKAVNNIPWLLEDIVTYNNGRFDTHPSYDRMRSIDGGNVNWLNFIRRIYLTEKNGMMDYYLLNKKVHFNTIKKLFSDIIKNTPEKDGHSRKPMSVRDKKKHLTSIKNLTKKQLSDFFKYSSRRKLNKKLRTLYSVIDDYNYEMRDDNFKLGMFLVNFSYFNNIEKPVGYFDSEVYHMVHLEEFADNYSQKDLDTTDNLLNKLRKLNEQGKLNFNSLESFYFEIFYENMDKRFEHKFGPKN